MKGLKHRQARKRARAHTHADACTCTHNFLCLKSEKMFHPDTVFCQQVSGKLRNAPQRWFLSLSGVGRSSPSALANPGNRRSSFGHISGASSPL